MARPPQILLLLVFLLLDTVPAAADGLITNVKTAPPSPVSLNANSEVFVTVTVTGPDVGENCGELVVSFDDGTQANIIEKDLSESGGASTPPHKYTTAKTYHITATAINDCDGSASYDLVVNPTKSGGGLTISGAVLAELCKLIGCGQPKGELVAEFSNVTSGGWAMIKGSSLGYNDGEIWLKGLTKCNGAPFGNVTLTNQPNFWTPTLIGGMIPTIVGVKDQPAKLQVKTKAGQWSNEIPINFVAGLQLKQLPSTDVTVSCSDEADLDQCNNIQHTDLLPFCSAPFVAAGQQGDTIVGYHWTCIGSSDGTDSFSASLSNGWRFHNAASTDLSTSIDNPFTTIISGFQPGATSTNLKIKWNNLAAGYVLYRVDLDIKGPKGCPHK